MVQVKGPSAVVNKQIIIAGLSICQLNECERLIELLAYLTI